MPLVRAQNCVYFGMAADSATMPLHWIYDQSVIADKLSGGASPSFFDPPSCPFYKHPAGVFSPYGDESLPLLRSMAENKGDFDKDHVAKSYHDFFSIHGAAGDKGYEAYLKSLSKVVTKGRNGATVRSMIHKLRVFQRCTLWLHAMLASRSC